MQNALQTLQFPLKYLRKLLAYCRRQSYKNALVELGVQKILQQVLITLVSFVLSKESPKEEITDSAESLLQNKFVALDYAASIAYHLGELAKSASKQQMSKMGFLSFSISMLLKIRSAGNPNFVHDKLIASLLKLCYEVSFFSKQENELLFSDSMLELCAENLRDNLPRVLQLDVVDNVFYEFYLGYHIANNILRMLLTRVNDANLKTFRNGVLIHKVKDLGNNCTHLFTRDVAQALFCAFLGQPSATLMQLTMTQEKYQEMNSKHQQSVSKCSYCNKQEDGNQPLKKCGACKNVFYCSRECQTKDWSQHKLHCSK